MKRDIVRVHAGQAHFDIDFDANFEAGNLELGDEGYNSHDMIAAIRNAIKQNNGLYDTDGNLVLITGPVTAYTVITT